MIDCFVHEFIQRLCVVGSKRNAAGCEDVGEALDTDRDGTGTVSGYRCVGSRIRGEVDQPIKTPDQQFGHSMEFDVIEKTVFALIAREANGGKCTNSGFDCRGVLDHIGAQVRSLYDT